MASPGNHEILYAFDGPLSLLPLFSEMSLTLLLKIAFLHRFLFPYATSNSPNNLSYSFDLGWVHFVTFNADGPLTKDFNFPTFPPEEIAWLKADLGTH